MSLNPFFIRAWVHQKEKEEKMRDTKSLNPFFIRAWVHPKRREE